MWYCFIMLYKVVLAFKSVDKTLMCDHSNESYRALLSCSTVECIVEDFIILWKIILG